MQVVVNTQILESELDRIVEQACKLRLTSACSSDITTVFEEISSWSKLFEDFTRKQSF